MNILITGGAGFIGSHVSDELLAHGHRVRAFDLLVPQVHGPGAVRPPYLDPDVELIHGDVRSADQLRRALTDMDAVIHLAAEVGVGQSMYEVESYTSTNTLGTAVLLQQLIARPVSRLVVASSMSLYGEGAYAAAPGGAMAAMLPRSAEQLRRGEWEPQAADSSRVRPVPTPETKPPALASVYALSKYDQERLCLLIGEAYGIGTVALRLFNVVGTRQALSNPYTGVLAIFASRLLNGNPPLVFEDGLQQRDFVDVRDVARAFRLALETTAADGQAINVGSGMAQTVRDVARRLARVLAVDIGPQITGRYRVGDVRHCFADIELARRLLGYEPIVGFDASLDDLVAWLDGQVAEDHVLEAQAHLAARGLTA